MAKKVKRQYKPQPKMVRSGPGLAPVVPAKKASKSKSSTPWPLSLIFG